MNPSRRPVSPTVLIVDDENRLREMLTRWAREFGYTPIEARTAEQAAKALEQSQVDILLLDLNLPGMDGMQLLDRIKDMTVRPEVIILTGFGSLDAAQQAIRLDVVDFLTKPCALGDLEAALERASRRLRREVKPSVPDDPQLPPAATLEELERTHILAALDRHHGNRSAVAAELGISERTLYYRLAQYSKEVKAPTTP